MRQRFKKISLVVLASAFIFFSVAGVLTPLAPARAIPTETTASIPETLRVVVDQIWQGLKTAVLSAVSRVVVYGMRKIAYDSAVWLASGGQGQAPLAHTKGFGDYMRNVADDALGHGVEELGKPFGLNLCKIPDIKVDLALRMGLRTGFSADGSADPTKKPVCTFSKFISEWSNGDSWQSKYSGLGQSISERFNQALSNAGETDLGVQIAATAKVGNLVIGEQAGQQLQRLEGAGFMPKKTNVSGQIVTPAGLIGKQFEGILPGATQANDAELVQKLISSGEIRVIPNILGIFLNTLVSSMVKNYQEKGILPFGIGCKDGSPNCLQGPAEQFESSGLLSSRRQAESLFSSFLVVNINQESEYDLLGELGNCEAQGTYNCRADQGLIQAAQRASGGGTPVTIGEALKPENGMLHGEWLLIPPSRAAENTDRKFCNSAYCHANLKVLRQIRLLPLGFEIAAQNSDPDKLWTLKAVVDGFNDCNFLRDGLGNIVGIQPDPINKPFCHLIDPNWVIKVPPSRCQAKVFGAVPLADGVPNRLEECADLQSCVSYNADGSCANYGYCTREQNVWKFPTAQKCDSQYRTCRIFTNAAGQSVSYLQRTLDSGACNADAVGCRPYSLVKDPRTGAWKPPTPPAIKTGYQPAAIYFNSKLSSATCGPGAKSAGCNAFQVASAAGPDLLYLRKAPDYLGCYDLDTKTPVIDWPRTFADLNRLPKGGSCSEYAGVCLKDEVGCQLYTDSATSDQIPGTYQARTPTAWNDECDASCQGYDTYRELPSTYSRGVNAVYIIPEVKGALSCTIEEEGCSSFTNVSSTVGGLEQTEYFARLRACVTPAETKGKLYITYEGSPVGGFQLQTFTLVENLDNSDGVKNPPGAPKYFYGTPDDALKFYYFCNESAYKAGTSTPADCRQFNDEQGRSFYRLLSRTIPVSEQCTNYRLNSSELFPTTLQTIPNKEACDAKEGFWNADHCELCFEGGGYRDGFCYYLGLPGGVADKSGASRSCNEAVESCRGYGGVGANNIKTVVPTEKFEGQATVAGFPDWSGPQLALSLESAKSGEHSLEAKGPGAVASRALSVTYGKSYVVTLWAKGTAGNLTLELKDDEGKFSAGFGTRGVGASWQLLRFGPLEYTGATNTAKLVFSNANDGSLFIDNITVVESANVVYRVKKTLTVPSACDREPEDNLPGFALGCREYKTVANKAVYLTNFSFLCRYDAIGCTAFLDTHNTIGSDATGPRLYKVWLPGASGTDVSVSFNNKKVGECRIPVGSAGCYATQPIADIEPEQLLQKAIMSNGRAPELVTSTIYIPADTPTSSPIYLVNSIAGQCNQTDLGCTYAGVSVATHQGVAFSTITIKNDPALYQSTLCVSESSGCDAFGDGEGGTAYFKDPIVAGQKVCEYKTNVGPNKLAGWFWQGVKYCSNQADKICTDNVECGAGNTCLERACYPGFLENNGTYGLWSYGVKNKYENFVGSCPAEQNLCTEFLDNNNRSASGQAKAHYYLKNSQISAGDCAGEVSQRNGCALFNQTDNPAAYWLTAESYAKSEQADGRLAAPVSASGGEQNDANIIIKVTRDRECGEWLQCRSSHVVRNDDGTLKNVCDTIGRCNQPGVAGGGDIVSCARWVDQGPLADTILTDSLYIRRPVGWSGQDFSGWSLLNQYPVEELAQVTISTQTPSWRLVKKVPCGNNCLNAKANPYGCQSNPEICIPEDIENRSCLPRLAACGTNSNPGVCLSNVCVVSPSGISANVLDQAPAQICRAYPEKDAPFPFTPALAGPKRKITGLNYCSEIKSPSSLKSLGYACECDYTRASYGDAFTRFWNYAEPNNVPNNEVPESKLGQIPEGICLGGSKAGEKCSGDVDCYRKDEKNNQVPDGSCQKLKSEPTRRLGWRGYCLEYDDSRILNNDPKLHPCLSWLPVDSLVGAPDINNQHREAGFKNPPSYFCLEAPGLALPKPDWKNDPLKSYQLDRSLFSRFGSYIPLEDQIYGTYANSGDVDEKFGGISLPSEQCETGEGLRNCGQFQRNRRIYSSSPLNQFDIERIIFTVKDGDNQDPIDGTTFEIWPSDFSSPQQASYQVNSLNNPGGYAVTGHYLNKPNEFILIYGSTLYDNVKGKEDQKYVYEDGAVCSDGLDHVGCDGLKGNIFKPDSLYSNDKQMNYEGIWDVGFLNKEICEEGSPHNGNWHAIRVRFDAQGVLQGYDTAYCDNSSDQGSIVYEISFKMKEWCRTIAGTTMNYRPASAPQTRAWTDRVWGEAQSHSLFSLSRLKYQYNTPGSPSFGSLTPFNAEPDKEQIILTPYDEREDGKCYGPGILNKECKYYWKKPLLYPAAPYSCPEGPCVATADDKGNVTAKPSSASNATLEQGYENLGQIFAGVENIFTFDFVQKKYLPMPNDGVLARNLTEKGDFKGITPIPPQVRPLGECREEKCFEGDNSGVSVNSTSSGNIYLFGANLRATLKFFGFADKNQMPLREIIVDWADGDLSAPGSGQYRNRRGAVLSVCNNRGFCQSEGVEVKDSRGNAISCKVAADCPVVDRCVEEGLAREWGQIIDTTCDNTFYQFDHIYRCPAATTPRAECGKPELYPDGCCKFRPRVKITDNWGWCNGSCRGNGCYDKECKDNVPKSGLPFAGEIIVAPPTE